MHMCFHMRNIIRNKYVGQYLSLILFSLPFTIIGHFPIHLTGQVYSLFCLFVFLHRLQQYGTLPVCFHCPQALKQNRGGIWRQGSRHNLNCLDIKEPPEMLCRDWCCVKYRKIIALSYQIGDRAHKIVLIVHT